MARNIERTGMFNKAAGSSDSSGSLTDALDSAKKQFFAAVLANDADATRSIVEAHPDAILWRDSDGLTGLMAAAKVGAKEAALVLIDEGANTEIENAKGSTALIYASFAGKAVVADALISAGADPNHANHEGKTPLMMAAAYGYKNTLTLLLDRGAALGLKDKDGLTALNYAEENKCDDVAAILRERAELAPEAESKPEGFLAASAAADNGTPGAPDFSALANRMRSARLC